jgi:hypothetical protein
MLYNTIIKAYVIEITKLRNNGGGGGSLPKKNFFGYETSTNAKPSCNTKCLYPYSNTTHANMNQNSQTELHHLPFNDMQS